MADLKFTAADVQKEQPPALLVDLKARIAAHLSTADKYAEKAAHNAEKADQNRNSAGRYLAQACEACDDGGFAAFHENFFPDLGRSRVYELMAIGTGKKTAEDIRKDSRERKAQQRERERQKKKSTAATPEKTVRDTPHVTDSVAKPSTPVERPAVEPDDPHAAHRRLMETLAAESLIDHWRRCADELRDLLDAVGVDGLLKAMSRELRDALVDRLLEPKKNSANAEHQSRH